jgi:hypothetical protein
MMGIISIDIKPLKRVRRNMGNQIGQKQAVVNAVGSILGSDFTAGETPVKDIITQDQLNKVRDDVFSNIKNGNVSYNGDTSDDKALRRYVNGMVQNHFRKAKELNGGEKYAPTGGGAKRDAQLSELKKLLDTYSAGSEEYDKIQQAISNREAELQEERKAAAEQRKQQKIINGIDRSSLPDDLAQAIEGSISN